MDAKSKADFINSVGGEQKKTCSKCNALNKMSAAFCYSCGNKFPQEQAAPQAKAEPQAQAAPVSQDVKKDTVPFQKATKKEETDVKSTQSAFEPVPVAATAEVEEVSVFAQGLPTWDVIPPQTMVRRKKKK